MTETTATSRTSQRPAWGVLAWVAALAGSGICAGIGLYWPNLFWPAWHVAAVSWLGTSLGCLGIALLHATTGGRWGDAIRRPLRAGLLALPVGLISTGLVGLGLASVFPWAISEQRALLVDSQQIYLAPKMVAARFLGCSVLWLLLAGWVLLNTRESRDGTPPARLSSKQAAIGLMLFFVSTTLFTIDSMMSVDPGWASSLFPLIRILSFAITGMAAAILLHCVGRTNWTSDETDRVHDLANLLQAFNLLWTYLAFSQFLLIWAADLPHENSWYLARRTTGSGLTSLMLFFFHFLVPFFLLLSRDLKRNARQLSVIAALLLVMCGVDTAWTILPSVSGGSIEQSLLTAIAWLTVGAFWGVFAVWGAGQRSSATAALPAGENAITVPAMGDSQ